MLNTVEPERIFLGAPRPSAILPPGLRRLPEGLERNVVPGGGAAVIALHEGDVVDVTDVEGLQLCEVVTADETGRCDLGVIAQISDAPADGLPAILAGGSATPDAGWSAAGSISRAPPPCDCSRTDRAPAVRLNSPRSETGSSSSAHQAMRCGSRPGDYVLMRALTDLVCVSSACPDDISAANGWDPTDIHVRTYSDKETFSRAIAFRMTPDAEPELTRETAFHESFSAHTRSFTEYKGFWLPTHFNNDGAIEEYWACRERAVVMDLSPLRKFEVTGPDAEALMQYTLTRNVRKLSVGQVVYSAMCYEHGGMLDDGTVFRLGEQNFRWIGGDEYGGKWLRQQAEKLDLNVWVRSSTDHLHNIAVQGPKSRDILKDIIWTAPTQTSLEELQWFRFTIGRIGDYEGASVVVSRTGYTGELGYEIWCHPKDAKTVFDAVWAAGEPHGLACMGLEALDMVRIEAGLIFFGAEFCDQTDPFEAGIGFSVALKTKEDDFIGRDALIRRKEHPSRKLVGLEIDGNEAVGHGDCVHIGRPQIGEVTSATRSPILKKNIALARLDVAHTEVGTEVEIGKLDGHQKRLPARVVAFPHFDPTKSRARS